MQYTINHKPPHVFEYIMKCNKHEYVYTFVETKEYRRLFDLKIGLNQNNRMKKWKFYRSDLKAIFKAVLDIFGNEILTTRKDARAIIIQLLDVNPKDGELYWKMLNAIKRKYASRFNIYVRVDGIGTNYKFLVVKRPYDDTDIFAGKFGDIYTIIEINPKRRVSIIKKRQEEVGKTFTVRGKGDSDFDIPKVEINDIDEVMVENVLKMADDDPRTALDNIRNSSKKYSKEYWQEAKKYSEKLLEETTFEEKSSIAYYTDNGYKSINNTLREVSSGFVRDSIIEHFKNIKNVFEKAPPLETPITVLRSLNVPVGYFEDMGIKEGDVYIDPGFMSTSFRLVLNDNVIMRIIIPAGSKALFVAEYSSYPDELEILLQAGSVLKLLRKDKDNIYTFLYLGNISEAIEEQIISEVEDQLNELKKYYEILEIGDVIINENVVINKYSIDRVFVRNIDTKEYNMLSLNNEDFLLWARNVDKLKKENVQEIITYDINSLSYGDAVFDNDGRTYLICSNRTESGGYYCTDLPEMVDFELLYFSEYDGILCIKNPVVEETPPMIAEIEKITPATIYSILDSGNIVFVVTGIGRKVMFKINDNSVLNIFGIDDEYSYSISEIDKLGFYNLDSGKVKLFNIKMSGELFVDFDSIKGYEEYFIIDVNGNNGDVEKILGSRIEKEYIEGKLLLKIPQLLI